MENGATWLVLIEALGDSGVDTDSANIGNLMCNPGRRLVPLERRRLEAVSFALEFVASFADVSDASIFASSVESSKDELQTVFETLAERDLGVNVTVIGVTSVTVTDNSGSSSGASPIDVFSVAGAIASAAFFSFW
jgi:hypothetical protein